MAALSADRNTPAWAGDRRAGLVAAGAVIFGGALVMRNATGYLVPATVATALVGVGCDNGVVNNTSGANGAAVLEYRIGTFRFNNAGAADLIAVADIGKPCFALDDQTVAKTDNTGARSPAGIVADVDANGVWVRLDEALTRATD